MKFLTKRSRLFTLALGMLAAAALFAPGTSYAHVQLVKEHPSGTAKTSLKSVWILFSGPIRSGTLKVYGPNGAKVSNGNGGRDPRNVDRVRTSLGSGLKPGKYSAKAVTVAADGHTQHWSFTFRLKR